MEVNQKRKWDGHCPECKSDDISLLRVTQTILVKRCSECNHKWNEEKVLIINGQVWRDTRVDHYICVDDI